MTWGAAATDQHRERLEMFKANAHANLEGAARHQLGDHELERDRVPTLNDVAIRRLIDIIR